MNANDPTPPASAAESERKPGGVLAIGRRIPRDGGTLLGAGVALGGLSWYTHFTQLHFGPAAIPAWVPLALDAAIAITAGVVLAVGARWFADDGAPPPASSDFVVVARPVWEGIQREVISVRGSRNLESPGTLVAAAPTAASTPAVPAVASALPAQNPWDEGPPEPVESKNPPPAPEPAWSIPTSKVEPRRAPIGGAPAAVAPPPATLPPPAVAPSLSPEEVAEMIRLGGMMGIIQHGGESDNDYARRLSRELELASKASETPAPPPRPEAADPAFGPEPGASPDIDELMSWLDKMKEEQAQASLSHSGKRPAPKGDPSESDSKSA